MTTTPQPATRDAVLVDPGWLEAHLHDPSVRVVEVDVSRRAYDEWHIDGAVLWNVYADLKDADYRLADAAALQQLFARSGIGSDSTVVFYGYAPAMGFWLMKLYGHADVRILDCSRDTWQREDRPRSTTAAGPAATGYIVGGPDGRLRADHAAVRDGIADPGVRILDVRSAAEYRGERFWPSGGMEPGGRAGRVPSAVHQPVDGLYDDRGAFRPAADLRRVFPAAEGAAATDAAAAAGTVHTAGAGRPGELITYCTIGGRASTAWFVLTYLLGRENVRVYDGSWAEWGRMTGTPVERS
jgi:thiosulfate/3-mercaptopyruvate sulfurtransferase